MSDPKLLDTDAKLQDYSSLEAKGQKMQECIESQNAELMVEVLPTTNKSPVIPKNKLWKRKALAKDIPAHVINTLNELEISTDLEDWTNIMCLERDPSVNDRFQIWNHLVGLVGPNTLVIENMKRSDGPHASEVALFLWKSLQDIKELKRVFVTDVCHGPTRKFIQDKLYEQNDSLWPGTDEKVWEQGTSGYKALLGTKVGRVVGFLVLQGFGQAQYRISRVVTWASPENTLQMRFDIEEISKAPGNDQVLDDSAGGNNLASTPSFPSWKFWKRGS
ncbi:hypothetical protein N7492_003452 [Penicillium capsulatum]|uniref:Uncharacterized protein n=1 Tax=Penicillium capsulatum TaxID=69766 RepID=A0A9W9ILY1_9EURO|nr:hypothetical protein N7492_003452 [Penicillium capsulatum]KAJ6121966.1 hypothetical protein N7512_004431 [Penicillium capsulatum]